MFHGITTTETPPPSKKYSASSLTDDLQSMLTTQMTTIRDYELIEGRCWVIQ